MSRAKDELKGHWIDEARRGVLVHSSGSAFMSGRREVDFVLENKFKKRSTSLAALPSPEASEEHSVGGSAPRTTPPMTDGLCTLHRLRDALRPTRFLARFWMLSSCVALHVGSSLLHAASRWVDGCRLWPFSTGPPVLG